MHDQIVESYSSESDFVMLGSERFSLNKAQVETEALVKACSFEPLAHQSFIIVDYDEKWPKQFQGIKSDLQSDLADANVSFSSIEHIGSTSVPGLGTKATTDPSTGIYQEAVLDICIVIPQDEFTRDKLAQFQEALLWGRRQGGYGYIGDGGVADRWSFKVRGITPLRNLYVVGEGGIPLRSYLSLRKVLREDANLRAEYENTKRQLAKSHGE